MALVLNTEVGGPNANSYATVAEANVYNESVMSPDAWTNAEVSTKNRALVTATRLLDMNIKWSGQRTFVEQSLDWPRRLVVDARDARWYLSHLIIPKDVKNATAELARRLIESGMPDVESDTAGLRKLKAGPVDIEWEPGTNLPRETMIDRYVLDMVSHLAIRTSESGGIVVPLVRV